MYYLSIPGVTDGSNSEDKPLVIQKFDYEIEENSKKHHTREYEMVKREKNPYLVVRRGQQFTIKVTFNRSFHEQKDALCLVLTLKDAKNPSYSQNTMLLVPVEMHGKRKPNQWTTSAILAASEDNVLAIQITPSAKAIIGEWQLDIDSKLKFQPAMVDQPTYRYTINQPIFILFNPWCPQDSVFMSSDDWKKEYISSDVGIVWRGTHSNIRQSPWNYGQFEKNVLECCLYILSKVGKLSVTSRGDPVKVARHISAVVNVQDDNGVIVGNWKGNYKGGTPPTKWAGSMAILQKYFDTNRPVKFGQCWVFSGVVTTVCRAIGIPSRCVTNFSSAHDTHNSLTVDYFFNEKGEGVDDLNIDSVWNFHVWNEVWMERPDLEPESYGGWQAIDATPQELSDGLSRCGPAPVKAVKKGEVMKNFDVPFIFAEVNADKVYWRYSGPNQPLKLITKKAEEIGKHISTKAVGKFDREDITDNYKFNEKTREEREVMLKALRQSANLFSRYYLNDDFEDVEFNFQLKDDILIGSDFKLAMKNKNWNKTFTVRVILRIVTMMYNGQLKNLVKKQESEIKLKPNSSEFSTMDVSYEDYNKHLVDQSAFHISTVCKVQESGFDYFAQDDFRIKSPDIQIQVDREIIANKDFSVICSFKNPLPKKLTKGHFVIEGPGLNTPSKINVKSAIKPKEECRVSCMVKSETPGPKSLIAKFESKELQDIDGFKEFYARRLKLIQETRAFSSGIQLTIPYFQIFPHYCRYAVFILGINQLGGEYANGRALPLETRWKIIQMSLIGYRPCHISRHLLVSHGCVSKIISRFSTTGSIFPGAIGGSKPRVSTPHVVQMILEYKRKNKTVLARQIRSQLILDCICHPSALPSISSINRILRSVRDDEVKSTSSTSSNIYEIPKGKSCKELQQKNEMLEKDTKKKTSFLIKDILRKT
ncbi:Annulin [Nymphon striatum]|nr:Annulin [Nymphon striatum]